MPFQEFASFFAPEQLDAMVAAYDAAWQQLWIAGIIVMPSQAAAFSRKLSQIILACACKGERDPQRLRDVALRALLSTDPIAGRSGGSP
jgi:hypothetical protein